MDMTTEDGVAIAVRTMEWVGQGMPGLVYSRKADRLVRFLPLMTSIVSRLSVAVPILP